MTASERSVQSQQYFQVAIPTPLRRLFDYLPPASGAESVAIGARVIVPFGRRKLVGMVISTSDSSAVDAGRLKPISQVLDSQALLPKSLMETLIWAANYYQHPCGEVIATALPTRLRKGDPVEKAVTRWRLREPELLETNSEKLGRAKRQRELLQHIAKRVSVDQQSLLRAGFSAALLHKLVAQDLVCVDANAEVQHSPFKVQVNEVDESIELNPAQSNAIEQVEATNGFNCFLIDGVTGSGKTEVYSLHAGYGIKT